MNARPIHAVLLGLLLLAGCAGIGGEGDATPAATIAPTTAATTPAATATVPRGDAATATAPESGAPAATAAPTQPAASPTASPESLEAQFAEIERRVVELRGLEPTEPIAPALISREQLHENLVGLQAEEYTEEEARQDAEILWLLRLSDDRNLDLFGLYIDLLGELVLGYYNPDTRELYVVNDEDALSPLGEMTLAHEMTHALQHQHFALIEIDEDEVDGDRMLAYSAIIEGDAEVTATRYVLDYFDRGRLMDLTAETARGMPDVVDRAPAYVREGLFFPYIQGVEFATQLYQLRGTEGLDEALDDPPTSTEQILHPEKYLDERDEPLTVVSQDLEPVLGEGWDATRNDSIGEFDLRVLLRENGAQDPDGGAAGWGGGQFGVYSGPDGASLVAITVEWDTEADADEFVAALGQTFGTDDPTGDIVSDDQGRHSAVIHRGTSVTLITGTDRDAVERARQALATNEG